MSKEIHISAGVELRAENDGKTLVGYAAVFDAAYDAGYMIEYVRKGAFTRALAEKQDVRALIDHESSLILGRNKAGTLDLAEDSKGLAVVIKLGGQQYARDLRESVDRGDISQMSFAFRAKKQEWIEDGPKPIRSLLDVDLLDVSAVTYPAYGDTSIAVRSHDEWRKSNTIVVPDMERINRHKLALLR